MPKLPLIVIVALLPASIVWRFFSIFFRPSGAGSRESVADDSFSSGQHGIYAGLSEANLFLTPR